VRFSQPSSRRDHVPRPVVHPVIGGPPAREQIRQRARPSGPGPAASCRYTWLAAGSAA